MGAQRVLGPGADGVFACPGKGYLRIAALFWWLGGVCAVLFLLAVPRAAAQSSARVSGFVHDPTGAVVPGATVILRDEATGNELRGVSDGSGFYSFDPVLPKTYSLTVEMKGFKTRTQTGIVIHPADRLDYSANLEVGQQVERVQVTARAESLVTTDSGAKVDVIGAREIQHLSIVGRNAMELLAILPGVVNSGFDPSKGTSFLFEGINQFHVNGLREDQNDLRMDNAHMIDPGDNGGFVIEPNMEIIQEFSVKTSNFEADQGRSPMIVDTVTKSGGSSLHGTLYWYHRNPKLNASDFSNNLAGLPKPNSRFNYFGYTVGGPVKLPGMDFNKNNDKMFFFVGMEWQRQLPDLGSVLATVPTLRMRQGDFSELLNPKFCATDAQGNITGGRFLSMPCLLQDSNSWGSSVLPGNILPASLITDSGRAFLNLFPLPNADPLVVDPKFGKFNFASRALRPRNRAEQVVRVDYNVNNSTRVYLRLAHNAETQFYDYGLWSPSPGLSNLPQPTPVIGKYHSEALTLNIVRIINPTLTNEFQFNTQALWLPNRYQDPSKLSKKALGFKNGETGAIFKGLFDNGADTVPQITDAWNTPGGNPGAGRWGLGNVAAKVFADKTEFEFIDNLSKVQGAHSIKFGFLADRTRNDQNLGTLTEGRLVTDSNWGSTTGNEFGDILTEHYKAFEQESSDNVGLWRFWNIEAYALDSWKVSRRLTLNYGARFSWMQPWNEVRKLAVTFDPPAYDPSQPNNFLNGLLLARKGEIPNGVYPDPLPVFQPRIGFAWDLFGIGKSVVRGGFGTFVQRDQGNISFSAGNAPPNSFHATPIAQFNSLAEIEKTDPFGALGSIGFRAANRRDASQPQVYEWSLTWSQRIGLSTLLETSYVGNVSRHLFAKRDINALREGTMWKPGTQVLADINPQAFRQYKPWGSINWSDHSQTANYNSLQVTARRNVAQGLTFLTSYTWSKTLGYSASFENNVDPFDTRRNYGLLPYDRAHLLNFSYIYNIPSVGKKYFRGTKAAVEVFDGWTLSGITRYSSGAPLKIGTGGIGCNALKGPNGEPPLAVTIALCDLFVFTGDGRTWFGTDLYGVNPIILFNPQKSTAFKNLGDNWLNPASFTLPNIGQFGTFEHPTYRGPASNNWDLTLFKSFPLGEKRKIEFRWAVFNVPNRAQFLDPVTSANFNWNLPFRSTSLAKGFSTLSNPDAFGRISNKIGHREMMVAIKMLF